MKKLNARKMNFTRRMRRNRGCSHKYNNCGYACSAAHANLLLWITNLPHALYLTTVQAQVQEVEAVKERKAVCIEAVTNQVQGLEGRVQQLDSEKEREQLREGQRS